MNRTASKAVVLIKSATWNGESLGIVAAWKFKSIAGKVRSVVVDCLFDIRDIVGSAPGELKIVELNLEGEEVPYLFLGMKPGPCWMLHQDRNPQIFRQVWLR